jgi:hypothetical protein
MILGRDQHPASACFEEINAAVEAMTTRVVCFNTHEFPNDIPDGAIVYNLENPAQVSQAVADAWKPHERWDFSEANAELLGATHVPVGYHPTMERFRRDTVQDIDVVFTGCLNERRTKVLEALAEQDLKVVAIPPGIYGAQRDAVLARAKLALNMLYHEMGVFPALRYAHLAANRVPVLSETCPEVRGFQCPYDDIVANVVALLGDDKARIKIATIAYDTFRAQPMVLPS